MKKLWKETHENVHNGCLTPKGASDIFFPLFSCFSPCTSPTHINPQIIYMLFSKGKNKKETN